MKKRTPAAARARTLADVVGRAPATSPRVAPVATRARAPGGCVHAGSFVALAGRFWTVHQCQTCGAQWKTATP